MNIFVPWLQRFLTLIAIFALAYVASLFVLSSAYGAERVVDPATYSAEPGVFRWKALGDGDDDSTYYYATNWRSNGFVVSMKKVLRGVSGKAIRYEFIDMLVRCEANGTAPDVVGLLTVIGIDARDMVPTESVRSQFPSGDYLALKRGSAITTAVVSGCAGKNTLKFPPDD